MAFLSKLRFKRRQGSRCPLTGPWQGCIGQVSDGGLQNNPTRWPAFLSPKLPLQFMALLQSIMASWLTVTHCWIIRLHLRCLRAPEAQDIPFAAAPRRNLVCQSRKTRTMPSKHSKPQVWSAASRRSGTQQAAVAYGTVEPAPILATQS